MKITKAMGRACLKALQMMGTVEGCDSIPYLPPRDLAFWAVFSVATDEDSAPEGAGDERRNFYMLALAMCAAIAGVRPE